MNLLTNLVPGLRDLRTPLAVGYTWIAIGWLCVPLVPSEVQHNSTIDRATSLAHSVGLAGVVGFATFSAYIVGLLADFVNRIVLVATFGITAIILGMATIATVSLLIGVAVVGTGKAAYDHFLLVLAGTAALGAICWLFRKRLANPNLRRTLWIRFREWSWERTIAMVRRVRLVRAVVAPGSSALDHFVRSHVSSIEQVNEQRYVAYLRGVAPRRVRRVGRLTKRYAAITNAEFSGKVLTELVKKSYLDVQALEDLRGYLAKGMSVNWEVRVTAYAELMDLSEWTQMTLRELKNVEVQLRASQDGLYSDVDRYRAEAEFRIGLSAPVGILAGMAAAYLGHLVNAALAGEALVFMSAPIGTALAAALYYQGYRKEEQARHLLVSCLQTSLVKATERGFDDEQLIHLSSDVTILSDEGRSEIKKALSNAYTRITHIGVRRGSRIAEVAPAGVQSLPQKKVAGSVGDAEGSRSVDGGSDLDPSGVEPGVERTGVRESPVTLVEPYGCPQDPS